MFITMKVIPIRGDKYIFSHDKIKKKKLLAILEEKLWKKYLRKTSPIFYTSLIRNVINLFASHATPPPLPRVSFKWKQFVSGNAATDITNLYERKKTEVFGNISYVFATL